MAIPKIAQRSPWAEPVTLSIDSHEMHASFMIIYYVATFAYAAFIIFTWAHQPDIETFSSLETKEFGPLALDITIVCEGCVEHAAKKQNVVRNASVRWLSPLWGCWFFGGQRRRVKFSDPLPNYR